MAMADVKKTVKDFDIFVASFAQDAETKQYSSLYRNGFALYLYYTNGKQMAHTAKLLDEYLMQSGINYVSNVNGIKGNLFRLLQRVTGLKKNCDQNWHFIEDLLLKHLLVPVSKKISVLIPETTSSNVDESVINSPPQKKLKTDCKKCPLLREASHSKCRNLAERLRETNAKLKMLSQSFDQRVINQSFKRKAEIIKRLRQQNRKRKHDIKLKNHTPKGCNLNEYSTKITKLECEKKILKRHVSNLKRENMALKKSLKLSVAENKSVFLNNDSMKESNCNSNETITTTTDLTLSLTQC